MTSGKTKLEVTASTVEEAIEQGLAQLGLTRDDVEVEVIDEGKRNFFFFSSRQAQVKLIVKENTPTEVNALQDLVDESLEHEEEEDFSAMLDAMETGSTDPLSLTKSIIQELLFHMGIKAEVQVEYGEKDESHVRPVMANIEGNDLSFLIGRRSETINALQFITSLMIGNRLNRWIPIQIDVQGYRSRRERELRKIARRMADQVVATGRKQFLEPMPANERRIIHMELRDHSTVRTESTGEEPFRKVTISIKK